MFLTMNCLNYANDDEEGKKVEKDKIKKIKE